MIEGERVTIVNTDKKRWVEIPTETYPFAQRLRMAVNTLMGSDLILKPKDIRFLDLRSTRRERSR